ncbi:ornithine cyclodeaminase family protein [Mobilicoccus caccae]|uniref:ornithine cyclodeaminase family protein n=1 Tax=Mobilicoccus caccae TaxID=1859295 RepID=UPI0024E1083E|nr:ornithine cyclodeaminase family protein [Mobilicoccus caccae]
MSAPTWIGGEEVRERVSPDRARRLLEQAILDGFDPAGDPPRAAPRTEHGQLLVMPSTTATAAGVKVASVAPDNPARGLERIQALYVLMDAETLTPSVLMDGTSLTALRTPAVSALGLDRLAPAEVTSAVIVGNGPQAVTHAEALLAIRDVRRLTVAGRDQERVAGAAERIAAQAREAGAEIEVDVVVGRADLEAVVREAQVVVCVTSAAEPVIDGAWVADGAAVVAVGSHETDRRELDAQLMGRALVVVEDIATALREAGDVVMAIAEGALAESDLVPLRDLVRDEVTRADDRPNVFKTVGMSWEDLVIAEGAAHP